MKAEILACDVGACAVISFFKLLIGQHGFTVEIISPPVGLTCS